MMNPENHLLPAPSSPTISSLSSSDLDTESTGSFFPDRSTTLGTLMGVTFPSITFRGPSQRGDPTLATRSTSGSTGLGTRRVRRERKRPAADEYEEGNRRRRKRWWWGLCGDDGDCGDSQRRNSAKLGEFLEVERRFGDEGLLLYGGGAVEIEGLVGSGVGVGAGAGAGQGVLFADGRVLPPQLPDQQGGSRDRRDGSGGGTSTSVGASRFPISFTGICSRAVG